ncbi:hypothetical protein PsorP6_001013 [Peronosclerospora sorghi]|uniref:Uncharacterized protein n=1 Tax=Peronosclerospora sorghi TaxID=230839 RepID=A0ACC0WVP8_9STRA|nr:hypothetical protein PsorP6_001013 [Peronosclerospora sorghi]
MQSVDEDLWAVLDDMLSFESSEILPMADDAINWTDNDDVKEIQFFEDSAPVAKDVEEPLPTSVSSHPVSGKRPRKAPTSPPQRRRKRPKDELDYLRVKVVDLEKELQSLQPKPEIGSPATVSEAAVLTGETDASQDLIMSWKGIAQRQKQQVDRSIVENMRLRAMLEEQLKVAKSLETAFDRLQRDAVQLVPPFGCMYADSTSTSDELLFAQLAKTLESQYAEMESDFTRCGIRHDIDEIKSETKVHVDDKGLLISHGDVKIVPYSPETVLRAIWSLVRYRTAKDVVAGTLESKVVDEDHINVTITERLKLKNDRVPSSVVRLAKVSRPEMTRFALVKDQEQHIGEITELVVSTVRSVMRFLHHITDTLLLQEAMGEN